MSLPKIKLCLNPNPVSSKTSKRARDETTLSSIASSPVKTSRQESDAEDEGSAVPAAATTTTSASSNMYAEYNAAVRQAREYRLRRSWSLHPIPQSDYPEWSAVLPAASPVCQDEHRDITGAFVCTWDACYRTFDSQSKWRRHQSWHYKPTLQ